MSAIRPGGVAPKSPHMFPGFRHLDMRTRGAVIRLRHGGSGPPLLMLHGYPVSHVSWYKIAARLSNRYHVVLADLRGYGDSSLPAPGPDNANYSFRVMAEDMIAGHGATRAIVNSFLPGTTEARASATACASIIRSG